ncbi:MAG: 30S ribosomal protein S1 [Actinobacteria bacterium]|nr:30S ribosomal protein S1 [Actinomycetota bacterium]MBL7123905.1 30S ribosomal protein S1 [Actinomycetota bacterium]
MIYKNMIENNIYNKLTNDNYMIKNENGELVPNYDLTMVNLNDGDVVKGKVVKIDKVEVLVDVGFKSEGVIPLSELSIRNDVKPEDVLKVDDEIMIMVIQKEDQDGRLILSKKRAEVEQNFDRIEKIYENGDIVEGEIIECVKGGLIVDIGLRGFLPASLIDVRKTKDLQSYIGERCVCKIIEVDRHRNNVVLSRKVIIEDERKEQRKEILNSMEIGQIKKGTITSIADFGAFVDVGGVDGLVHISELSWNHVKHPSEVVNVNQEVDVEILGIDYEKQRLSLGLKQTQKDPWLERIKDYSVKDVVKGKVTRIVKFGLFVQIEEGLEGLVHISELSLEPVKKPSDVAKIGDELMVRIIDIDFDKRRMAFSVKQVENPVEDKEEEKKVKDSKTEEKSEKKEVLDKESNKKRQIKEILKEMKEEANIE